MVNPDRSTVNDKIPRCVQQLGRFHVKYPITGSIGHNHLSSLFGLTVVISSKRLTTLSHNAFRTKTQIFSIYHAQIPTVNYRWIGERNVRISFKSTPSNLYVYCMYHTLIINDKAVNVPRIVQLSIQYSYRRG